jgi:hypothetical protein
VSDNPCILGIDPGATSGALAFYFPAFPSQIMAEDMPTADKCVDAVTLALRIEQMRPDLCLIEAVWPRPLDGKKACFSFGVSYGMIRGVVLSCKVPLHFVTPQRWKKHFDLIGKDKEASRARAISLWPGSVHFTRKKDQGRSEAALIARYGAEKLMTREAAQ